MTGKTLHQRYKRKAAREKAERILIGLGWLFPYFIVRGTREKLKQSPAAAFQYLMRKHNMTFAQAYNIITCLVEGEQYEWW